MLAQVSYWPLVGPSTVPLSRPMPSKAHGRPPQQAENVVNTNVLARWTFSPKVAHLAYPLVQLGWPLIQTCAYRAPVQGCQDNKMAPRVTYGAKA